MRVLYEIVSLSDLHALNPSYFNCLLWKKSHVFLNLRHDSLQTEEDWCEWWTKMAANLNVFKKL